MSRIHVNRFLCKLRLIQHGLLSQVEEIEQIHLAPKPAKADNIGDDEREGENVDTEESESEAHLDIIKRRSKFVRDAIRTARRDREARRRG